MVLRPDVLSSALDKNVDYSKDKTFFLSPRGKTLNQDLAKDLVQKNL